MKLTIAIDMIDTHQQIIFLNTTNQTRRSLFKFQNGGSDENQF